EFGDHGARMVVTNMGPAIPGGEGKGLVDTPDLRRPLHDMLGSPAESSGSRLAARHPLQPLAAALVQLIRFLRNRCITCILHFSPGPSFSFSCFRNRLTAV